MSAGITPNDRPYSYGRYNQYVRQKKASSQNSVVIPLSGNISNRFVYGESETQGYKIHLEEKRDFWKNPVSTRY